MDNQEAAMLFARLVAHYPALGGEAGDLYAEIRVNDWLAFLAKQDFDTAATDIEVMLTSANAPSFPPKLGEFAGFIEQRSRHRQLDEPRRRALPEHKPTEQEYHDGLFSARVALANATPFPTRGHR